jgi:hypothetical protein
MINTPLCKDLLGKEHGNQGNYIPVKSVRFGRIFLTSSRACQVRVQNREIMFTTQESSMENY